MTNLQFSSAVKTFLGVSLCSKEFAYIRIAKGENGVQSETEEGRGNDNRSTSAMPFLD